MRVRTTSSDKKPLEVTVGGVVWECTPLSTPEQVALRQKHTSTTFKRGVPIDKRDDAAFGLAFWQQTIKGWHAAPEQEGLVDADSGEPLECTPEAKRALWTYNAGLVADVLEALEQRLEAGEEGERGN